MGWKALALTHSATWRPSRAPWMSAERKWMPCHTRASMVSSTTSVRRWYWRVTLGTLGATLTRLKFIWSEPKNALPAFMSDPDMQLYPDVWSLYGGAGSSGVQAVSPIVRGLPSLSPSRMAVIGRQKAWNRFSFQQLMSVSAPATLSIANNRASSTKLSPWVWEIVRNVRLSISNGLTLKKRATASCSGLRGLSTAPRLLTSLYSWAYAALLRLRGPGVRNCEADNNMNGSTSESHEFGSITFAGGIGRHSPGSVPTVSGNGT